ncbi:hypothetical protein [Reyranella sp.]|jgi:hypothetical protein|uniref:hypothetical protein n=1 Tax=Reyranella sp. TaxID=1929291 RepID=UPI003F722878
MIKSIVLVALVGTVVAGCSVRTERVVEAPAPTTTTQRTTTVSSDPYTPAATTTTTTYTTPTR